MKKESLSDKVKTYYQSQQMRPETLARLKAMTANASPGASAGTGWSLRQWLSRAIARPLRIRLVPAAAVAVLVVLISNMGVWYQGQRSSVAAIRTSVAREIAMNHLKNLDFEYRASSIEELQRLMPALDFETHSPDMLTRLGLTMEGARYCTIQGHLAVQIKLKDGKGRLHTIYQAPCLPPLQTITTANIETHDLQIRMWSEKGVFFGLAGPLNS